MSTFNEWTEDYKNDQRLLRKKMKYYTSMDWKEHPSRTNPSLTISSAKKHALHPKSSKERDERYIDFTAVGNLKTYYHRGELTYPEIGEPTSLGNKKFIQYTTPLSTTPYFGTHNPDASNIDTESKFLQHRIGEATNLRKNVRYNTTGMDWDRWHFVDKNVVQNPKHIVFADGVIPVGGVSSRNQMRNYTQMKSH